MYNQLIERLTKGGEGSGKRGHTTAQDLISAIPKDHARYQDLADHINQLAREGKTGQAYQIYGKFTEGDIDSIKTGKDSDPKKEEPPKAKTELDPKTHVGLTSSQKPIPINAKDAKGFNAQDHADAMNAHAKFINTVLDKVDSWRAKNTNKELPGAIVDTLIHHFTQQRIHQQLSNKKDRFDARNKAQLASKVKKSEAMIDHNGTTIQTGDFAMELVATKDCPWVDLIRDAMRGYEYGDAPRSINLSNFNTLHLVKVDEGTYSGYVTRGGETPETVNAAKIERMTIPTMVIYLKAMELIVPQEESVMEEAIEVPEIIADSEHKALETKLLALNFRSIDSKIKVLELIDKILNG